MLGKNFEVMRLAEKRSEIGGERIYESFPFGFVITL